MTDAEKTEAILQALQRRAGAKEIWATELALGSGARRCDFWTLHPHASKGYLARAYEIKVSRSDWRRETPMKQRDARLFTDEFYYVAPAGMIRPEELPDWAGLEEWHEGDDFPLRRKVAAPRRDKDAPSWELVVSIMRNSGDIRRDTDILRQQITYLTARAERAERRLTGRMANN